MGHVKNLLGNEIIQATTEAIKNIEMDSLEKEREEKNFELEKRVRQMLIFKDKILDDVAEAISPSGKTRSITSAPGHPKH